MPSPTLAQACGFLHQAKEAGDHETVKVWEQEVALHINELRKAGLPVPGEDDAADPLA
jgi:hypothetical protein